MFSIKSLSLSRSTSQINSFEVDCRTSAFTPCDTIISKPWPANWCDDKMYQGASAVGGGGGQCEVI